MDELTILKLAFSVMSGVASAYNDWLAAVEAKDAAGQAAAQARMVASANALAPPGATPLAVA